jgi:DNA-binding transcriptional regulator YiaG
MRYKANILGQLEQIDALMNRIRFQVNRQYEQEQILESVEMVKEQVEKTREIVSLEDDEFANQFAGR